MRQSGGTIQAILAMVLVGSAGMVAWGQPRTATRPAFSEPPAAASRPSAWDPAKLTAVRERTERRFELGAFLRPAEGTVEPEAHAMAPLIVQELPSVNAADSAFRPFGAVIPMAAEGNRIHVDTDRLTVYTIASMVTLNGREHRQRTYLWAYPPVEEADRPAWRGVRMTFGNDGFPAMWEVIASGERLRVLYVSASLESAARKAFGEPPAERSFAVESPVDKHGNVVVARVLDDGAQPMGPYVYLEPDLDVSTLLCRCMAAQVEDFAVNTAYTLVAIGAIRDLGPGLSAESVGLPPDPTWLERALRLPPTF